MALDPRYIPFYNIAQFIWDKDTALPLTAGKVKFWVDDQRATPKEVFRLTGISPNYTYASLGAELTLGATGAFVDNTNTPIVIYAFPYDANGNIQRYFLQVFAEDDTLQFVVEAAPYVFETQIPPDSILSGDNELNNSQFVEVSFNPQAPHTFNFTSAVNEEVQLAPDWLLIASGTGSVTVERIALTELNTPTNPPYVIDITSTGLSTLTLTQRLTNSPRLIARGFISGYFIAASEDNQAHSLQMEYNPSGGTLDSNIIIDETITSDGSYNVLQGNLNVTGIINPDPATTGYVDIDTVIPIGAHLRLSSFQIVQVNAAINIAYGQLSTPKQINTLFSAYKNSMQYMPKQSLTPWWKFGLNPLQFNNTGSPVTAQCSYIFDQTILYQAGSGSKVNVFIGPNEGNGELAIQAASGASDVRFALITYIAPQSIQGWWGYWMSVLARASLTTTHNTQCRIKVRIIYRTSLPSTIGAAEPIASWAPTTDPTFSAGWTALTPLNDPAYDLNLAVGDDAGDNVLPAFPFDQMQLPVPTPADSNMIGLVFYTFDALDSTSGTEDVVTIDSISLVPNQFAVDSTPLTADQVLRATQFYIETTYDPGTSPGTNTAKGARDAVQPLITTDTTGGGTLICPSATFDTPYSEKCIAPTITIYAPDGTSGDILFVLFHSGSFVGDINITYSSNWNLVNVGLRCFTSEGKAVDMNLGTSITGFESSAYIAYHAVFNSQLGQ